MPTIIFAHIDKVTISMRQLKITKVNEPNMTKYMNASKNWKKKLIMHSVWLQLNYKHKNNEIQR